MFDLASAFQFKGHQESYEFRRIVEKPHPVTGQRWVPSGTTCNAPKLGAPAACLPARALTNNTRRRSHVELVSQVRSWSSSCSSALTGSRQCVEYSTLAINHSRPWTARRHPKMSDTDRCEYVQYSPNEMPCRLLTLVAVYQVARAQLKEACNGAFALDKLITMPYGVTKLLADTILKQIDDSSRDKVGDAYSTHSCFERHGRTFIHGRCKSFPTSVSTALRLPTVCPPCLLLDVFTVLRA